MSGPLKGYMVDTEFRICRNCGTAMDGETVKKYGQRMRDSRLFQKPYACPICLQQNFMIDYKRSFSSKAEFFQFFSPEEILWHNPKGDDK
mgnify:CR=1 FL=1